MSALQFGFISGRIIAVYLAYRAIREVPQMFLMLGSALGLTNVFSLASDPFAWIGYVVGFGCWAALAVGSIYLWRHANQFAGHVLEGGPLDGDPGNTYPWEQSILTLAGVWILLDVLPLLFSGVFAFIQRALTPPYDEAFEVFMGQSYKYTPAQLVGFASEFALALLLVFRAPIVWAWIQSLQNRAASAKQAASD